jgi:hypothetical protein
MVGAESFTHDVAEFAFAQRKSRHLNNNKT